MKRIEFWVSAVLVPLGAGLLANAFTTGGDVLVAFPWAALAIVAAPLIQKLMGGGNDPSRQTGTQTTTSTSTPSFSPEFSPLLAQVMGMMKDQLNSGGLPEGYEAKGLSDINRSADLMRGGLNRRLAATGQLDSPVAGAAAGNLESARLGSVSDFLTETPLKEREMHSQDLAQSLALLGLGHGNTVTSTGTQNGTFTAGGPNAVSQTTGDMAQLLAYLQSSGAFSGNGGSVNRTVGT